MKLATYDDGSRDGQLVVVSRDLGLAHYATGIANTLQQVLDDWNFLSPQLQDVYTQLNGGRARHAFAFNPQLCKAPLARSYQWAHAYTGASVTSGMDVSHGAGDDLLGPCSDLQLPLGCNHADMDASVAVITGDIRMGSTIEQALSGIRLLMLSNAACWRAPGAESIDAKHHGADTVQARLAPAFSPVACTPDALGDAWQAGRLHLTLQAMLNGRKLGLCDAASAMPANFGELLARLAKARNIRCGAIVSAGLATHPDRHIEHTQGYTSIANKRAAQVLESGSATTDYLQDGDKLVIDMKGKDGASIFGAIHQTVFMQPGITA